MASDTLEVWLIRCETGEIIPMSPPLGEGLAQRLRSGALVRVNSDGSLWGAPADRLEPPPSSLVEKRADEAKAEAAKHAVPRPSLDAPKSAWALYASSTGLIAPDVAEDLDKDELVARFGEQQQPSPDVSEPADEMSGVDGDPVNIRKPKQASPKAVWVAWAVEAHGLSEAEADALPKADLIKQFG